MSREVKVELANMCMVCDGTKVLVQNRVKPDWRGIAFPGGHVEAGESVTDSVIREIKEETGLTIERPRLCGIKDWEKKDGTRYIIFYYRADNFSGELKPSEEGEIFWAELSDLPGMDLAVDVDLSLRVLLEEGISEFYLDRKGEDGRRERKLL